MRSKELARAVLIGLVTMGLSACATGLTTQVSRFQPTQMAAGQSFYVVPASGFPDNRFHRYASMVSQQLAAQGFVPAGAPQVADMLVRVDYGIDQGTTEIRSDPFYPGYGGWGYGGLGYGGLGYGYPGWGGYSYGWNDPYMFGRAYSSGISSYTVYKSYLDMDIVRRLDHAPLFEGHAKARSRSDELDALVPNLVTAMFTGFPGQNGETVKITIPTRKN